MATPVPDSSTERRKFTQEELLAEAKSRFGDDVLDIAFECPSCKDVAAIREFPQKNRDRAGQECIGRSLGAITEAEWNGRGCNWTAYGLFPGPWEIVMPDGHSARSFRLATPERTDLQDVYAALNAFLTGNGFSESKNDDGTTWDDFCFTGLQVLWDAKYDEVTVRLENTVSPIAQYCRTDAELVELVRSALSSAERPTKAPEVSQ